MEESKKPTEIEMLKQVMQDYGLRNRHERRYWGKLLKMPIPGLLKPYVKGNLVLTPITEKENAICSNSEFVEDEETPLMNIGCKNLRINGSSRCDECKTK